MKEERDWYQIGEYDVDERSLETGLDTGTETPVQQSFAKDADINEIVKRFGMTGELPIVRQLAEYGDFTGVDDLRTAIDQVRRGEEAFLELPAKVRQRFNHDPAEFWEWLHGHASDAELRELGLMPEADGPVEPVPTPVNDADEA